MGIELSGDALNRAIAEALDFHVRCREINHLLYPAFDQSRWTFYQGDTWLGDVTAETEDEAWHERWKKGLPDWAHDVRVALMLCERLREEKGWRLVLCTDGADWTAELQFVPGMFYMAESGAMPAEALARLALTALRREADDHPPSA